MTVYDGNFYATNLFAGTLTSTVATGTAPLTVTSTTLVSNLNSNYLNGASLSTSTALGTSDTLIPSQNAIKMYIDKGVPAWASTGITYTVGSVIQQSGILYRYVNAGAYSNPSPVSDTTNTYWALAGGGGAPTFTVGASTVNAFKMVYITSAGLAQQADYGAENTSMTIGIATFTAVSSATVAVQTQGLLKSFYVSGTVLTAGTAIFLGSNGGYITDPSTIPVGSYRVLIGYMVNANDLMINISEPMQILTSTTVSKNGLGRITHWQGSIGALPPNQLQLNGQSVNKFFYPDLFTLWGTTYGGSGNNFNLPDWSSLNVKDNTGTVVSYWVVQCFADTVMVSLSGVTTSSSTFSNFQLMNSNTGGSSSTGGQVLSFGNFGAVLGNIGTALNIISSPATLTDFGIQTSGNLYFATGGSTSRMLLNSSGNLLIGTTTDDTITKLQVTGAMKWGFSSSPLTPPYVYSSSDATGGFVEHRGTTTANDKLRFQASKSGDNTNYTNLTVDPQVGVKVTANGTGQTTLSTTGTLSGGILVTSPGASYSAISGIDAGNAPIYAGEAGSMSVTFSPVLGAKSIVTGGYRDHLQIGHYRPSMSGWGGIYFAGGGNDAYSSTYMTMLFGTGQIGWSGGTPTLVNLSDARLKTNIRPISSSLDKVVSLAKATAHFEYINNPGVLQTGFIAQRLEEQGFLGHVTEENPTEQQDGKLLGWEYRKDGSVEKEGAKIKKVIRNFEYYLFPAVAELLDYAKSLEDRIKALEAK
jgi:microcystin-dependent protein